MKFDTAAALDAYLSRIGPCYLYIKSYHLTHYSLHLLLTGEDIHDRKCDIFLALCSYIAGPTMGGPWQMRAEEVIEDGQRIVYIREMNGCFSVRAQKLFVLDSDEPPPDTGDALAEPEYT